VFHYNGVEIDDTFAEMFPMWAGRVLITAENEKWALTAARNATGFAASIIASPAEAGIEGIVPAIRLLTDGSAPAFRYITGLGET